MTIRVVLIGSECTGKTTLARKLASHFVVKFVPEYLREYYEQKQGNLTVADAIPIAKGQLQLEKQAEKRADNPIICDTDIISSIAYTKHYFKELPNWFENQLQTRSASIYLLCGTDVKWLEDGQRDMPDNRDHMQSLFEKELKDRQLDYHRISGPLQSRFEDAVKIISAAMQN